MTIATLVIVFFGFIALGIPIAVALGSSVLVASYFFSPIPLPVIGQKIYSNLDHFTLMAVPFFFFAAALMEAGGLVRRLIGFANTLVGHWRGGLGVTSVLTCIFFAAISGSSPATVAAVGRVMYPALLREGYSARYAIGALTTAGSIGILIPPSIPMILYGFITETSITRLFIAGIVPGLMYGAGMMIMARYLARNEKIIPRPRATWVETFANLRISGPALLLPLIIIVGIYGFPAFSLGAFSFRGGAIFTPTEASMIAASLALIIGMLIYRELTFGDAVRTIVATAPSVGMIFFIATNALLFAFFLTKIGVPQAISDALVGLGLPRWAFLLLVNLVLMIVGFFLEGVPVILMFVPVLFPAAMAMGVDPVHFGIIVIVNIELALVTPPVGLNLFVGSSVSGLPVIEVFRATLPWMIVTVIMLILVTYVPAISLFLPGLMFG